MNFIFIIINFVIFILIRIFMIFRSFCLHDILLYYMSRIRAFFVGCNVLIIIIIIIHTALRTLCSVSKKQLLLVY